MSVIIVSVGTSLLTNNIDKLSGAKQVMEAFEGNQVAVDEITIGMQNGTLNAVEPEIDGLWDFTKDFIEAYFREDKIKDNIARREKGDDRLPAEISSLYLYYYGRNGKLRDEFKDRVAEGSDSEFAEKDRVILLTTDTADAVYCANLLKDMISSVSLFNEKCNVEGVEIVQNLDVYNPENYLAEQQGRDFNGIEEIVEKGIGQLFAYFDNNFGRNIKFVTDNRVLIRTGGYKEFSADLKMLAMQFGFRSYYLFERSTEMIIVNQLSWPRDFSIVALQSRRRG